MDLDRDLTEDRDAEKGEASRLRGELLPMVLERARDLLLGVDSIEESFGGKDEASNLYCSIRSDIDFRLEGTEAGIGEWCG